MRHNLKKNFKYKNSFFEYGFTFLFINFYKPNLNPQSPNKY